MKDKPQTNEAQRMPWKKLSAYPGGRWESLPWAVRSLATEALRMAQDDRTIPVGSTVQALSLYLRVLPSERRAFQGALKKAVEAGVMEADEDAQCWRINTPDPELDEALAEHLSSTRTTLPKHFHDTSTTLPRQILSDNHPESLGRDLQDIDRDRDEEEDGEITHTPIARPRSREGDAAPLQLVLDGEPPSGDGPAPRVCVSEAERLVLEAWNDQQEDPRRRVRWNALRLKWFRKVEREEGYSAQELVAIVLGWGHVDWVRDGGPNTFQQIWSPKLPHLREEAVALGTYNPDAEWLQQLNASRNQPRLLAVGDPLGPDRYRFGATMAALGDTRGHLTGGLRDVSRQME